MTPSDRLFECLGDDANDGDGSGPIDAGPAWESEIARRLESARDGTEPLVPWDEAWKQILAADDDDAG